jgi:2-dehydro-3-deoxyphosphogluconate aldolase / (4S)-4-hydroxy-2-oxoglutarate aldolase
MSRYNMEQVGERLRVCGLVATLVVDKAASALPLADALLAGGIDVIELTLRTKVAIDVVAEIRAKRPEMLAGVGTVLTPHQVLEVAGVGVDFAVSPGLNPYVVREALRLNIPFAPGVCTPSDIEASIELGCKVLKFFPAEPSGGMKFLTVAAAPYRHLGIKYIPLGGLNEHNMGEYLSSEIILAVGGSWIASREIINEGKWAEITANVKQVKEKIEHARSNAKR